MQEPKTIEEKNRLEAYVGEINGMNINNVSNALRAEFARGDGRVKRKEDERRKKISPSETLFVVNFHEETTKREDLQMLFEPYGRLVRIEMKRNYAFVQFETVEEASRAKDATNGGKLDQSEITVEFVARRMGEGGGRERGRKCIAVGYDSRCMFDLFCAV
jgi:arginine/serine-rich splicing factor 4/5/6